MHTPAMLPAGGTPPADERSLLALPYLLPHPTALLPATSTAEVADDWERQIPDPPTPPRTSAVWDRAPGGLPGLQFLCWPQPPSNVLALVHRRAPWMQVNPPAERGMRSPHFSRGPAVPPEAVLEVPLDQRWLWAVRPQSWDGHRPPADEALLALPIAQRFRLAYMELEQRRAGRAGRKARRRASQHSRGI